MGWRHGHAIKDSRANSLYDARREARKAFLAFSSDDAKAELTDSEPVQGDLEFFTEKRANDDVQSYQNTPVYVLNPKQDLHGLGFDPYKHAPEFREKKRSRTSGKWETGNRKGYSLKDNLFGFKSGNVAPGFGIGALEELDAEDEDVYASGFDFEDTYIQEVEEPSRLVEEPSRLMIDSKRKFVVKEQGVLPGFRVASNSDYQLERFDAPVIPKDFVPQHKFPGPLETNYKLTDDPPPEVPPPEDSNLKLLIEGVATLVARCGKLFEDLSREKNQSNPLFSFLTGGNGHDYYTRKLWEERQKRANQRKQQVDGKLSSSMQKMTAESRGKILGEKPLERSAKDSSSSVASSEAIHLQFNLSDTFTKPASFGGLPEVAKPFKDDPAKQVTKPFKDDPSKQVAKPFKDDPAKQERFEQFLKEKYQGGLRTTDSSGASNMSEAARARERLDFEAAAEAIQKGQWGKDSKLSTQHFMEFSATGGMQFTSGGVEQVKDTGVEDLITKKMFPKREEHQWRPSPVLCKRFDLIDPYMGKPPPAPRMRSKIDSLIFTSDSAKATKVEETVTVNRDSFPTPQSDAQGISQDIANKEIEAEVEVENVERPVDLYKAIFSDDSDNEGENTSLNKVEDPEKKIGAATTTLNRLIAGDFLESLGKELGLEVPPDVPSSTSKARDPASQIETANANAGDANILPVKNKPSSTPISGSCDDLEMAQDGRSKKIELIHGNSDRSVSLYMETGSSGKKFDEVNPAQEDKKSKTHSSRRQNRKKSSSSEDERSGKWSRRDGHRSSDSDGDSSSDHRDRYRSRSKGKKKGSSREKSSSSRKHSKHHKRRSRDSPARSRYESDREHGEPKREKRKKRD
ncbi:G patch domain-containing protein TGH isoform X2 [Corylus avellana]|nr:G patch domain-containing protein TGH isoform X2 [Corylus avellana]